MPNLQFCITHLQKSNQTKQPKPILAGCSSACVVKPQFPALNLTTVVPSVFG